MKSNHKAAACAAIAFATAWGAEATQEAQGSTYTLTYDVGTSSGSSGDVAQTVTHNYLVYRPGQGQGYALAAVGDLSLALSHDPETYESFLPADTLVGNTYFGRVTQELALQGTGPIADAFLVGLWDNQSAEHQFLAYSGIQDRFQGAHYAEGASVQALIAALAGGDEAGILDAFVGLQASIAGYVGNPLYDDNGDPLLDLDGQPLYASAPPTTGLNLDGSFLEFTIDRGLDTKAAATLVSTGGGEPPSTEVPEPLTLLTFGAGAAFVGVRARRGRA